MEKKDKILFYKKVIKDDKIFHIEKGENTLKITSTSALDRTPEVLPEGVETDVSNNADSDKSEIKKKGARGKRAAPDYLPEKKQSDSRKDSLESVKTKDESTGSLLLTIPEEITLSGDHKKLENSHDHSRHKDKGHNPQSNSEPSVHDIKHFFKEERNSSQDKFHIQDTHGPGHGMRTYFPDSIRNHRQSLDIKLGRSQKTSYNDEEPLDEFDKEERLRRLGAEDAKPSFALHNEITPPFDEKGKPSYRESKLFLGKQSLRSRFSYRIQHPYKKEEAKIEDHDPSANLKTSTFQPSYPFLETEKKFKSDEAERKRFEEELVSDEEEEELVPPTPVEEAKKAKKSIQDLFIFVLFLITASVIVFSMTSRSAFYITDTMVASFMETPFISMNSDPIMRPAEETLLNRDANSFPPTRPTKLRSVENLTKKPSKSQTERGPPDKNINSAPNGTLSFFPKLQTSVTTNRPLSPTSLNNKPSYKDSLNIHPNASKDPSKEIHHRKKRQNENYKLINKRDLTSLRAGGGAAGGTDQGQFKTLKTANTVQDFWDFAETTLLNMLHWEFWFSYNHPKSHTEEQDKLVFYSSKLLGVARIRQLRVKPNTCSIHPQVSHLFNMCFGYYNSENEEQEDILPEKQAADTTRAWFYTSGDKLKTVDYYGTFSIYGRGGYFIDLSLNKTISEQRIAELKQNTWINRATRAIIIDFTIYNSNVNLFVVSKIVIEVPPTGGIFPQGKFEAIKLLRYVSSQDLVVLGFEFTFVLFIGYYTVTTTLNIFQQSFLYFHRAWNILDIIILILSYTAVVCGLYRYFAMEPMVVELLKKKEEHPEFDFPRLFQTNFDHLSAVLLFFLWIKLFKFLHFNKTINELNRTLARSTKGIIAFTLMFAIIFFAFAQLAYLIFGSEVEDYRTVWSAAMSLLQAVLGKFNYRELEQANYILGPLFLILFVFFIFFVLMNMFGAIIIESYKTVRSQIFPAKEKLVGTYLSNAFTNILTCGKGTIDKNSDSEKIVTAQKIRDALLRAGFTEVEIEIFFAKYEIRVDRDISGHEAKKLIAKLELRRFDFDPIDTSAQTVAELQKENARLQKVLEDMERKIDSHSQQLKLLRNDSRHSK